MQEWEEWLTWMNKSYYARFNWEFQETLEGSWCRITERCEPWITFYKDTEIADLCNLNQKSLNTDQRRMKYVLEMWWRWRNPKRKNRVLESNSVCMNKSCSDISFLSSLHFCYRINNYGSCCGCFLQFLKREFDVIGDSWCEKQRRVSRNSRGLMMEIAVEKWVFWLLQVVRR